MFACIKIIMVTVIYIYSTVVQIIIMVNVLLEYINVLAKHFLLCWHCLSALATYYDQLVPIYVHDNMHET